MIAELNSLFVGQLYKDLSLALRARELIFFTTDLQMMMYLLNKKQQNQPSESALAMTSFASEN